MPEHESVKESLKRMDLPLAHLVDPDLQPMFADPPPGDGGGFGFHSAGDGALRPDHLPYRITRAYDLSVSAALSADIPVVGGGSASAHRRVIVLEHAGYEVHDRDDGGSDHIGYAIRFCVTVNKLDANVKLSIPFITASAQLGSTEAMWTHHVIGLVGPKIAAVNMVPTDLNVETFVLAKQSFEALMNAIVDPQTSLDPKLIASQGPPTGIDERYAPSVAKVAALGAIQQGWTMQDAARRFRWQVSGLHSDFVATYNDVAGITSVTDRPSAPAASTAAQLLGRVNVRAR